MYRGELQFENKQITSYLHHTMWEYAIPQIGGNESEHCEVARTLVTMYPQCFKVTGRYVIGTELHWVPEQLQKDTLWTFMFYIEVKEEPKEKFSGKEQLLFYIMQVAMLNAARDYVKQYVVKTMYRYYDKNAEKECYISDVIGPGIMGMPLHEYESYYEYVMGESEKRQGKSFLGMYVISKQPMGWKDTCKNCYPGQGCQFCMMHRKREKR